MARLSKDEYMIAGVDYYQNTEPSTSAASEGEWWLKPGTDQLYYLQDGSWREFGARTTTPGIRGIFGGGDESGGSNNTTRLDYVTITGPGNASDFGNLYHGRSELAGTSNGVNDRGLFGGGDDGTFRNIIDYITISTLGNSSDFDDLSTATNQLAATSNGTSDRAIFGGGKTSGVIGVNVIEYFNFTTIGAGATDFGDLVVGRRRLSSTSNGTDDRGVFGGGNDGTSNSNAIDFVTISTGSGAWSFGDLTNAKNKLAATSNGTNDTGVFVGGNGPINVIDYIAISSAGNAGNFGDLTVARYSLAATSNGTDNRGIIGGGYNGSNQLNVIDYVSLAGTGNATDFGDMVVSTMELAAVSDGLL